MKILHLNAMMDNGGAARACLRLHEALLKANVESEVLVQERTSDRRLVHSAHSRLGKIFNKLRPYLDKAPILLYPNRTKAPFNLAWLPFSFVLKEIDRINPDIVHLHWIGRGMLPIRDLAKIKQPIVWSLHDMWAFSAGEHIHVTNHKEKTIKKSSVLNSKLPYDLSYLNFLAKKRTYQKIPNLHIIGLSQWLSGCAKESTLLKDKFHYCLPNCIDTNLFKPLDKAFCKNLLNISSAKKLIGFGAINAMGDNNKGIDLLLEALKLLDKNLKIECVIFGANEPKNPIDLGFKTHFLGHLNDEFSLIVLYNLLDCVIVPSRQENLSNVIMESLACATPVVGFNIGGNSDLIEHKMNGYLAKPFETQDLKEGIEWVINTPNYEELCQNARTKVLENFSDEVVAQKYIKLYESVLKTC
ncbi:glycosyltransferase [Helicobacter cetorum]|uniref:glycosyltransferase n=1 Tax=Helicobacter cetorum TaxID=138563 RepID=UPI000CF13C6D|nr:glycosyltransferase [Helicobacter cetorum]